MSKSFKTKLVNIYHHFMTYTIKNKIFNIFLTIIENIPILIGIDFMWADDFLSKVFTPLYYLAPHIYLDKFNTLFQNDCSIIMNFQDKTVTTSALNTTNSSIISNNFSIYNQNNLLKNLNISSVGNIIEQTINIIVNTTINNTLNLTNDTNFINSSLTQNTTIPNLSTTNDNNLLGIYFFSNKILEINNSYCLYSPFISIFFYFLVFLNFILFYILGSFEPKDTKNSCLMYSFVFIITNFINIICRPFAYLLFLVFLNKPIILLYQNKFVNTDYFSNIIIYTVISSFFLILFIVFCVLFVRYINNSFFFEDYPYDFYSKSDTTLLTIIKIFVGFKFNFDKLIGFRYIFFVNLLLALFICIRVGVAIANRHLIINNYILKTIRNFMTFFFSFYLLLKILNSSITGLNNPNEFGIIIEMLIILSLLIVVVGRLLVIKKEFVFNEKEEIIDEILRFFYYTSKNLIKINSSKYENVNKNKSQSSNNKSNNIFFNFIDKEINLSNHENHLIDDILIAHKMKCCDEECLICIEQISSPDSKTLFKIIYQQFLLFEKELKEENEELCLIIKLLLLKIIDENKIHRISYLILKNTKVSLTTYIKINYLYEKLLDEINLDLKNLLTIKYGEVYDDLLFIINYFEEIFGFVKSRTEKVELVINKTNDVGHLYQKILSNLYFLKRNKRIYFDTYNMLQLICIIRLIFQKNIDPELMDNLEYNFQDFLENVDRIFEENLSFIVRYDFHDFNWRIKKVPKTFIDITRSRVDDLIDQSLEKIFPNFMAKNIIKELEELILCNKFDNKLKFKTFILDSESNVRYVRFEIDIIPNLEGNYLLFLNCHFQQKQVMIIDEIGNFINGCDELYKKMGLKSEVISMSRGKINMFNLFNLEKNCKLEDVKVVSINVDNLIDIIKRVYLIDNENLYTESIPNFLHDLFNLNSIGINPIVGSTGNNITTNSGITISRTNTIDITKSPNPNQNLTVNIMMNQNMRKFRENNLIYLNLFEVIHINNKKYIVYSIKIKTDEPSKKDTKFEEEEGIGNKQLLHFQYINNRNNVNINLKDSNISNIGDVKSIIKSNNMTDSDLKQSDKSPNTNLNVNNEQNKNLGEYYNYFYETNRSASVTVDFNKFNLNSAHSHGNSSSSDVFSFLLLKTIQKSSGRTNYFEKFLYAIYLFNLSLVLLGLISIIYLNSYSKNTFGFIETFQIFNTLRTNIVSSTANILSMCKFTNQEFDNNKNNSLILTYDEFLKSNNLFDNDSKNFSYDSYIKNYNSFYSEIILNSYKNFEKYSYNLYGATDFETNVNFYTKIIFFNSIGNAMITNNKISDTLDYIPITINTLDKKTEEKIYINMAYLNFNQDFINQTSKIIDLDLNNINLAERNLFNQNYNLYKIFINYFSVYTLNFEKINKSFFEFGLNYTNKLQMETKILLILIVILHVIFVLISMFSIIIYRRILLNEFNNLYSISEDHLTKLKEKFKCVEEIIKSEKYPSKVYMEIRRMREIEMNEKSNKNKKDTTTKKLDFTKLENGMVKDLPLKQQISKNFLTPTNDINGVNFGYKKTQTKLNRKTTALSGNDSKDVAENYINYNYSGATKGLLKSFSIKNKEKMEEMKKQHSKAKASMILLSRLNFEFDFINNYINFISFMSIFYIVLGIVVIFILEDKYNTLNKSLIFTNVFVEKNINFYNYLIGVKLSIILNRQWPNTIKPDSMGNFSNYNVQDLYKINDIDNLTQLGDLGFYTELGIINDYYNATNTLFEMETENTIFNDISNFEVGFKGDDSCSLIYEYDNDILTNMTITNPNLLENLVNLCKKIPIMHSNLPSIFTYVTRELREILNSFLIQKNYDLSFRVNLLQNKFRLVDLIYFIFIEPYFKYVRDFLLKAEINLVVVDYFNFLIVMFTLNIFIDFLMLIFIWFKNYKQVIKYVNNIQLVADSITNL